MRRRAQVERPVVDGRRCERPFAELVRREQFVFFAGADDVGRAIFVREVDAALGVDRRRGEAAAEPFGPMIFAGVGVEAGGDAVVGDEIHFVAHHEDRRRRRHAAIVLPDDVRFGRVARRALRIHSEQIRADEARAKVEHSVGEHGPRDDGKALVVIHAPQLVAIAWVVGARHAAAGADDLLPAVDFDHQRRAERKGLFGRRLAGRSPALGARCPIESHDERFLVAVATKDQKVVDQCRRTAVAMLRQVMDSRLLPEDVACEIEGRGAHVAEVDVNVDSRRRSASRSPGCSCDA